MKNRSFALASLVLPALALLCGLQASSQQAVAPAAAPPAAAPAASVYNIEVIVFRATSALGSPEGWISDNVATPESEDAETGTPQQTAQTGKFVGMLPATQFQLSDIESKLKSSGTYVPVAHAAWSQTASAWGTHAGFPVSRLGLDAAGLSGTIFLERGQYLHLGMVLNYAPANPPAGLGAGSGTSFVLNTNRRIRFYERNYYDHPAFGVIALVTPAQGARPAGR
jgi:hypothetical protein